MRAWLRVGDRLQRGAHQLRDFVALPVAVALAEQIHLDVGDVGSRPHVVMPHQAVEVVRRRGARVGLDVDDFFLMEHLLGQQPRDARGLFERGARRHVDDDLELALVVERQHLHFDEADVDQRHRAEQQQHDAGEKAPAQRRVVQQAAHEAAIQAREPIFPADAALRLRASASGSGSRPRASRRTR